MMRFHWKWVYHAIWSFPFIQTHSSDSLTYFSIKQSFLWFEFSLKNSFAVWIFKSFIGFILQFRKLHLRCLTGFWIRLWKLLPKSNFKVLPWKWNIWCRCKPGSNAAELLHRTVSLFSLMKIPTQPSQISVTINTTLLKQTFPSVLNFKFV